MGGSSIANLVRATPQARSWTSVSRGESGGGGSSVHWALSESEGDVDLDELRLHPGENTPTRRVTALTNRLPARQRLM